MPNPFRSFQHLPWSALLLSAGLTVLVATAIDILFGMAIAFIPAFGRLIISLPLLNQVLIIAAPFGVGALAIYLTLQFFSQILLRTDTIWSLIGCVLLILLIKNWLPIPSIFLKGFNIVTVMMVTVGSFTAGRRYWR